MYRIYNINYVYILIDKVINLFLNMKIHEVVNIKLLLFI